MRGSEPRSNCVDLLHSVAMLLSMDFEQITPDQSECPGCNDFIGCDEDTHGPRRCLSVSHACTRIATLVIVDGADADVVCAACAKELLRG